MTVFGTFTSFGVFKLQRVATGQEVDGVFIQCLF